MSAQLHSREQQGLVVGLGGVRYQVADVKEDVKFL